MHVDADATSRTLAHDLREVLRHEERDVGVGKICAQILIRAQGCVDRDVEA